MAFTQVYKQQDHFVTPGLTFLFTGFNKAFLSQVTFPASH